MRFSNRTLLTTVGLVCAVIVIALDAQGTGATKPIVPPVSGSAPMSQVITTTTPTPALPPALTTLEQRDITIASLQQQLALVSAQKDVCQGQLAPAQYQNANAAIGEGLKAIRATYEKNNPGWTLNDQMQPVKKGG